MATLYKLYSPQVQTSPCSHALASLCRHVWDSSVFTDLGLTLQTRVGTLYKLYSLQVQTPPCSQALASPCGHVWLHSTSSTHHRYTPLCSQALASPCVHVWVHSTNSTHHRYRLPPCSLALASPCGHVWLHSTSSTHHRDRLPSVHRHWPHPADMCGYTLQALLTTGSDTPCSQALASPRGHVWLRSTSSPHHRYRHPCVQRHLPHPADTCEYTRQALLTTGIDTSVHRHLPHPADTFGYTLQALLTTGTDTPVFTGIGLTSQTLVATLYKLYSPQVQTPLYSQALASPADVWLHSTSSTHHRYRHPHVHRPWPHPADTCGYTLISSTHHRYRLPPCSLALASHCRHVWLYSTSSCHHRYRHLVFTGIGLTPRTRGYTLQVLLTTDTDIPCTLRTRVATLYTLYSPQVETPPCSQALASPCGHMWLHSTSSTHHRYRLPPCSQALASSCGYV